MKYLISIFFFLLITNQVIAEENVMILKLKDGDVKIELFSAWCYTLKIIL